MTLSSAGVTLAQSLRFFEILQRILRGIYLANAASGQIAEVKGFARMVWDFSFEHECAELKQLAPVGYDIALHIKDTTPRAPIARLSRQLGRAL